MDLKDLYGKRATYKRTAADGTVETRSHALYDKNCLRLPWNWRPSAVGGMRAVVRAGGQTVRFDGEQVVVSAP